MTSMPASRRARAITLAPRSWPSSPGLATRTRMGWEDILEVGSLRVSAEDGAEGIADFSQGGVGSDGVEQERHGVFGAFSGALEGVECVSNSVTVAPGAECGEFLPLVSGGVLVDLQQLDGLLVGLEAVDADDDALPGLDFALVSIAGGGDFGLREAGFDGGDHAAHAVDFADVFVGGGFCFERKLLQEVAAAERIGSGC